ncbi:hypothetical protein AAFN85_28825 [Mucilaginibacter sp. CAU 1740]|uniref:hypothetical protein n=1 Tax=Mucilaginibacter sp. CAU 1740 TaxID=3140365 RepID=UPI00325BD539
MSNPLITVNTAAEFDAAFEDENKCYFAVLGNSAEANALASASLQVAFSNTPRFVMRITNTASLELKLRALAVADDAQQLNFDDWCAIALSPKATIVEIYGDYDPLNAELGFELAETYPD